MVAPDSGATTLISAIWMNRHMGAFEVHRYEQKHIVTESAAARIRNFLAVYLKPDEYMAGNGPLGYRIYSLYLDTPKYALYQQTMDGLKNRFKLRIRFYDENPFSPAFLEVKRRITETIHKLRATVTKRAAERLLRGARLSSADLIVSDEASLRALTEFCDRRGGLSADGRAFVGYRREAYVSSVAEGVRVTFDRQIVGYHYGSDCKLAVPQRKVAIAEKGVVLELKFTGRPPAWMQDLIETFHLQKSIFPKYVYCVNALQIAHKSGFLTRSVRC